MERKINKLEHSHVEVIVTVDKESWKKAQNKAFEKAASKVEVKGFRKGKAPLNMVKERVNQAAVMDDAINSLLPDIYRGILEEEKIRPYAQPQVDVTKISEDELEVKFVIVTAPEVKLGKYKGLKLGKEEAAVSEEDIDKEIQSNLDKSATLVLKEDGETKEGDTVVMDFVGTVDGEKFEGGSAENYELILGSHSFIPGFEEQLIGHKAGDHVDVNVTFPEQYTENLKGKAAVFACDIHEVKEKKLPELNDEFVKSQGIKDVETVAQYRDHIKELKLEEAKRTARSNYFAKLYEAIAKDSEIDIPEEIIENQVASRKDDFLKRMQENGLTLEQYLQIIGQNEEAFTAQIRETALKELTNYLILEKVGEVEKLNVVTDEELEFEIAKLADQYHMEIERIKSLIEKQMGEFKNNIVMNRVENFLFVNND